jgi:hypothetical protein
MIILLDFLKDDLEADQAGPPADFDKIPLKLLKFMVLDAGEDQGPRGEPHRGGRH